MSAQINLETLTLKTYSDLVEAVKQQKADKKSEDFQRLKAFENWVLGLYPETDNELGLGPEGTLAWVYEQYNNAKNNKGAGLYTTLILFKGIEPVATVTICKDDREVGQKYNLNQDAMIGFLQVAEPYRRSGIGHYIMSKAQEHIQSKLPLFISERVHGPAEIIRRGIRVTLFTNSNYATAIFEALGFTFEREVETFFGKENLFVQTYTP